MLVKSNGQHGQSQPETTAGLLCTVFGLWFLLPSSRLTLTQGLEMCMGVQVVTTWRLARGGTDRARRRFRHAHKGSIIIVMAVQAWATTGHHGHPESLEVIKAYRTPQM